MGLFDDIEGLRAEDLTTAILCYLLSSPNSKLYRDVFLSMVLKRKTLHEISLEEYEVNAQVYLNSFGRSDLVIENFNTQVDPKSLGRADLVIDNSNSIVLIENKFYAEYSGGDQIKRYQEFLSIDKRPIKVLCLLSLRERQAYYEKQLNKMFELTNNDNTESYIGALDIDFVFVSWEDVLAIFGNENLIVHELQKYIHSNYLTNTLANAWERDMMNSGNIPELLEKIWNSIDKVKTHLASDKYLTMRTSQSRILYGFPIDEVWGQIWVEYYHKPWKKHSTPFFMQIRESWISESVDKDLVIQTLLSIGFVQDKDVEYIFPIRIVGDDLVDTILVVVKEKITLIRRALCII